MWSLIYWLFFYPEYLHSIFRIRFFLAYFFSKKSFNKAAIFYSHFYIVQGFKKLQINIFSYYGKMEQYIDDYIFNFDMGIKQMHRTRRWRFKSKLFKPGPYKRSNKRLIFNIYRLWPLKVIIFIFKWNSYLFKKDYKYNKNFFYSIRVLKFFINKFRRSKLSDIKKLCNKIVKRLKYKRKKQKISIYGKDENFNILFYLSLFFTSACL